MRLAEPQSRLVLIPYDPREGISLNEATALTGKKVGTIRNWCVQITSGAAWVAGPGWSARSRWRSFWTGM
jgi:hypothetical protein